MHEKWTWARLKESRTKLAKTALSKHLWRARRLCEVRRIKKGRRRNLSLVPTHQSWRGLLLCRTYSAVTSGVREQSDRLSSWLWAAIPLIFPTEHSCTLETFQAAIATSHVFAISPSSRIISGWKKVCSRKRGRPAGYPAGLPLLNQANTIMRSWPPSFSDVFVRREPQEWPRSQPPGEEARRWEAYSKPREKSRNSQ